MRLEKDDAKVGLLVLLTLGLFVGFILHRGMTRLLRRVARVQVRLENAADVATGTEVQLQGLRVGQVDEVRLRRDGVQYHFLAQLGLRPDIVLWEGTRVVVVSKPLGGAFLDLQLPPPERRDEPLKAETVLPASASPSLGTLVDAITTLVVNLDRGVDELRGEFKTRGLGALLEHPNVARPLQSVDRLAGDSRQLVQRGQAAVASLDQALVDLQGNLAQVRDLLAGRGDDLDAVAASLGSTMKEIEALARELRAQVAQAGPDTDAGLKSLDRTLRAAEELLELLKNKPSRIIWGKPSQKEKDAARERAEAARKAQGARP
jgi:ABC-type transporter Mla subunit MlaD